MFTSSTSGEVRYHRMQDLDEELVDRSYSDTPSNNNSRRSSFTNTHININHLNNSNNSNLTSQSEQLPLTGPPHSTYTYTNSNTSSPTSNSTFSAFNLSSDFVPSSDRPPSPSGKSSTTKLKSSHKSKSSKYSYATHTSSASPSSLIMSSDPEPSVSRVHFHESDDVDDASVPLQQNKYADSEKTAVHAAAATAGAGTVMQTKQKRKPVIDPNAPITVIAFLNFNSGGKMGKQLADKLTDVLGADKVFNLAEGGPKRGLELFKDVPNLRVAVGGGDGTINWLLGYLHHFGLDVPIGFIPLGTGNDTSRAFGWGFKFPGLKKIKQNLEYMQNTREIINYDRWHVTKTHTSEPTQEFLKSLPPAFNIYNENDPPEFNLKRGYDAKEDTPHSSTSWPLYSCEWNNYLSFGIDANIQYDFHVHRENNRKLYCSRICNMTWMGCFGFRNFVCCKGKQLSLELEVRNEKNEWVPLPYPPGLKSIVLQNITTYAGGRKIWGKVVAKEKQKPKEYECYAEQPSLNDGLIEVIGIKSALHLGGLMINIGRGVRLAQVNEIRIRINSRVFAQMDGEPWIEEPCVYHIRPLPPSKIMLKTKQK